MHKVVLTRMNTSYDYSGYAIATGTIFEVISTTSLSAITISAGGSGYSSAPTVVFTGGGAVEL